jgi:hypothetical protein
MSIWSWRASAGWCAATARALPISSGLTQPTDRTSLGADADQEETVSFGGWKAEFPALRAQRPLLMDFDTWLAQKGKSMIEELLSRSDAR